jgi:hypothetical protein
VTQFTAQVLALGIDFHCSALQPGIPSPVCPTVCSPGVELSGRVGLRAKGALEDCYSHSRFPAQVSVPCQSSVLPFLLPPPAQVMQGFFFSRAGSCPDFHSSAVTDSLCHIPPVLTILCARAHRTDRAASCSVLLLSRGVSILAAQVFGLVEIVL